MKIKKIKNIRELAKINKMIDNTHNYLMVFYLATLIIGMVGVFINNISGLMFFLISFWLTLSKHIDYRYWCTKKNIMESKNGEL